MAKPLLYPEWATTDTTLPATGNTNKQRPKESLRNIGWDKGQVPTAEEWNWQFDNISDWVKWFDENNLSTKTLTLTGGATGTSNFTNEGNISVSVDIKNNSHTHTSANISDATSSNTADTIIKRDSSGNFSAGIITAAINGNSETVTTINNNISILTGIIAHGGTIPLPSGYSEGQCRWIVSTAEIRDFGGDDVLLTHHCFTTGRVVSCYTDGTYSATGNANYIIIGFK